MTCTNSFNSLACFVLTPTPEKKGNGFDSLWTNYPTKPIHGVGSLWVGKGKFDWVDFIKDLKCEKFGKFCAPTVDPMPEVNPYPETNPGLDLDLAPVPLPDSFSLMAAVLVTTFLVTRKRKSDA